MRDLIVNGVPMRDPLMKWRVDYTRSSIFNTVSRATPSTDQIGYHGVDATGPAFFGAGQHTLVLNLECSSRAEFASLLGALQSLLSAESLSLVSAPQMSPLRSAVAGAVRANRTFNVDSDELRVATARMIGSLAIEYITEKVARLTAILQLPKAFWQSQDSYTGGMEIPQGTTEFDLTTRLISGNSTAPLTEGLIRVRGTLASSSVFTIRDRGRTDRGLAIRSAATLQSDQYILIDPQRMIARRLTTDTWDLTAGTDVRNYIELTGDGGFTFEPVPGFANFPSTPNRYWATVTKNDPLPAYLEVQTRRSFL